MEAPFTSERRTIPWNFGDIVLILFHHPLAVERKHHRIRPETSGGRSITSGKLLP